jgi:hypothetical protein
MNEDKMAKEDDMNMARMPLPQRAKAALKSIVERALTEGRANTDVEAFIGGNDEGSRTTTLGNLLVAEIEAQTGIPHRHYRDEQEH